MLDDFKDKHELAYNIIINELRYNKISHAYLIDQNDNDDSFEFVMAFIKALICSKHSSNNKNCNNCYLCKRIDDGNYPEIKIIEPDGMFIKKQQILDLQKEFSRTSVEGSKKIYVIKECDKMRAEAANSMLKFLEEPDNDIVAILMTNNYNNVLKTIISRCQIIKLSKKNIDIAEKDETYIYNLASNFVDCLEKNGVRTLINIKDIFADNSFLKDRQNVILLIDNMIDIYYFSLKCKIKNNNQTFICSNNDVNKLIEKIKILNFIRDKIKYNININLLIDNIIVNIGGA